MGDEGQLERKADIFYKRTIKPHTPVTSVDTSSEALAVSMGEKARVDMDYMCELTGKTEEEIFADLKGVIFLNPMHGYGISTQAKSVKSWYSPESQRSFTPKITQSMWKHWNECSPKT